MLENFRIYSIRISVAIDCFLSTRVSAANHFSSRRGSAGSPLGLLRVWMSTAPTCCCRAWKRPECLFVAGDFSPDDAP